MCMWKQKSLVKGNVFCFADAVGHRSSVLSVLRLSASYPALQEKLNSLVDEDFGLDPQKANQDRENLRNIKADLISQERKLKGSSEVLNWW